MRAGPAGRLARASARRRTSPERRQSAPSTPAEGRQDISDASNLLKSIDFRALRLRRKKCEAFFAKGYGKCSSRAPAPKARPRSGICFVYVRAGWRFFEKASFLYLWIFAHRPACHPGGLRKERTTKKTTAHAYGFRVCHRFLRTTLGPGNCRGPNCKKSTTFPRRAGGGDKGKSRLLVHRRGLRRYYFHWSQWGPGENLRAWCCSVF